MTLPKTFKNNESGQVLVIFLLVLVIGLALVLSIASRTVTDIRQTTTSDESNRAYFAAESGVEDALKRIEDNSLGSGSFTLDLSGVNRTNAEVDVSPLTAPVNTILDFLDYAKDDVAQISMLGNFDDLNSRSGGSAAEEPLSLGTGDTINIYWGLVSDASGYTSFSTTPAIEVSVVTFDGANWGIRKSTFSSFAGSNFCQSAVSPGDYGTKHYRFRVIFDLDSTGCGNGNEIVNVSPVVTRIRFLNAPSPLGIESTTKDLPQQGHTIESIGETPSGVSRRIQVRRFYPTLPAIFDYVLYNGSSQPLCKGAC